MLSRADKLLKLKIEKVRLQFIIHQFAGIGLHSVEENILIFFGHRLKGLGNPDIHFQLFDGLTTDHSCGDRLGQGKTEEVFCRFGSKDFDTDPSREGLHSKDSHSFCLGFG